MKLKFKIVGRNRDVSKLSEMKKVAILCCLILTCHFSSAQCNAKQIVNECKPNIAPYQYDSYSMNKLVFDTTKSTTIEVEFTAFQGQEYKLVFSTSHFKEDFNLNIYDKALGSKNRKK